MAKKALVLGGGVAGLFASHYLSKKGYKVSLIERDKHVGGLAKTLYYGGHPYEFGPHIWFWPDPSPINDTLRELANNQFYTIDRKLYSYIEKRNNFYRYPIHFDDIKHEGPNVVEPMFKNRDVFDLIKDKIPKLGKCTFSEYFNAVIGEPLFDMFMRNYSWKMWGINPDELQTSMVWADRIRNAYDKGEEVPTYDPIKFSDHNLGSDLKFQVYPKHGWNILWFRIIEDENITLIKDSITGCCSKYIHGADLLYTIKDYDVIINTLDLDLLIKVGPTLPYMGRMIVPMVMCSDLSSPLFLNGAESIHYSGSEFQTRVTDMSTITKYTDDNDGRLMLIEIPINTHNPSFLPENVYKNAVEKNLICFRAYPRQSKIALENHKEYVDLASRRWPNMIQCGRHAEFRYMGMPETAQSAYDICQNL